jgi:hypothetical protein
MSVISETIEVQARKLPGVQGTVCRWLGTASAWLGRDEARWLRLAVAARMIAGGRAVRSGADRRPPVVSHR